MLSPPPAQTITAATTGPTYGRLRLVGEGRRAVALATAGLRRSPKFTGSVVVCLSGDLRGGEKDIGRDGVEGIGVSRVRLRVFLPTFGVDSAELSTWDTLMSRYVGYFIHYTRTKGRDYNVIGRDRA